MNVQNNNNDVSPRSLGLFDVICIIVGIIIGSAIYKTPTSVARELGSGEWILFVWMLGGVLAFIGALCYAELASAYPKEGGDYYFLHHTYGSWAGFLYAWGRLLVIHSGNIAMMAYIAGEYGEQIYFFPHAKTVYSIIVIIGFTGINCLGLREGKWTQNILASVQVIGLLAIVLVAFLIPSSAGRPVQESVSTGFGWGTFFFAMILVQVSYGGWSDCAFVASEIKNPGKNIFRALLIGLSIVTLVYVLINSALLYAMGAGGMGQSEGLMAQMMESRLGTIGASIISVLVIVCALGSVNGMIIVGGRIYHAFGRDHSLFQFLGQWNRKKAVPLMAFLIQGFVSCVLLLWGRFEDLVIYTSAAHWLFMLMIGVSLIVLRIREPAVPRPYRVPLYPLIPVFYIVICGALLYSSFNYGNFVTPYGAWMGFGIVLAGLPVYWISQRWSKQRQE